MSKPWIIEVREETTRKGRFSWQAFRHRDGSKNVAEFGCLGRLKRFAKHHIFSPARAVNRETHQYETL